MMSTDLTLMGMPPEILLMILTQHFSNSVVKTRKPIRRSTRNQPAYAKQQTPISLSVLLVNKTLFRIGTRCFHEFATVYSETIFKKGREAELSWVYYQVPWNRIRYVCGNYRFAESLRRALEVGGLRIDHLREVAIHYSTHMPISKPRIPLFGPVMSLNSACRAANTNFRVFVAVAIFELVEHPDGYPLVVDLKCVISFCQSIELHKATVLDMATYMRYKKELEQCWSCDLPSCKQLESIGGPGDGLVYRSNSVQWYK